MTVAWVALGGGVGAALRYLLAHHWDARRPGRHLGTLAANTGASLLLGACTGWGLDGSAAALVGTGLCGGLSTYSSLAVQARDLGVRRGLAYAVLTVALGLGAAAVGFLFARG